MPNARVREGESPEQSRTRYNAEMRAYRQLRKKQGRPLKDSYRYESSRDRDYRKKYGLLYEEVAVMLAEQDGGCAICNAPLTLDNRDKPKGEHSHIDHCHATGKVRGVLCAACNLGIGKFKDDTALLKSAISYLERP